MVLLGSSAFAQTRLTPSSLSFGNQSVGIASAPATATFKNTQSVAMTIKSIAIAGGTAPADFAWAGNCPVSPATLGAGKSCSITVTFTPSALGSRTATMTLTHSAFTSPQSVALSGTGVSQATLSASSLNFGTVAVGNVSAAKSVTLTNHKNTPLAFSSISPSGDFSIATNTCGASIAAGATCTISVTFTPATTGSRAGTLTFNDNATNSPQTVSLTGTGSLPVTASPASLTFSSRTMGTTSSAQTVTLTNHLNTSLAVSPVVVSGDFEVASNTCSSSVAAGLTCKVGVTFTPRVVGVRSGTLTISYSAFGSPSLVTLTGTGNASGLTSIVVTPANPSIQFGTAIQFVATGKFSGGGSQDLTASVAWSSSAPTVATISNAPGTQGIATSVARGSSTITATLNSISGLTTMTVAPPPLVSIAVNPSNGTVPVGRGIQFHATGTYADNSTKDLTSSATWTSSVVTVAAIGANTGMASASGTGQTTIQAAYNSIGSNQAALLVTPGFVFTGSLNTARENHTATLLNNGKDLLAGGFDGTNNASATAELYDPAAGTFSRTGSLNIAREYHTATLLNNGKVLFVGGFDSSNSASASAELYDPVAGTFSPTGSLNIARGYHTATLLNDGIVLIAGGFDSTNSVSASAELYDPVAGTFSTTGSLNTAREYHTATLLNNGMVLLAGGFNGSVLPSAELYDPTAGAFTPTGSLNTAREYHTATLLNNGMVLLAGGFNGSVLAIAELYDPVAGIFSPTGSLNTAREYHTATLLNNGTVLLAGGVNGSVSASAELYDPTIGSFSTTGSLNTAREYHTTTLLNNGMVLIAGGSDSTNVATNNAELYEPGTLTPAGLVSISVSPVTPAVPLGATQRLIAAGTFVDGTTQTLSSVTWSSSDATVATITNDATNLGAADAVATGSATLSACAGSLCGSTTLTAAAPALVTIVVTPANGALPIGQSVQFDAVGTYTDSSTRDLTSSVAWSSESPLVATISSAGLASGVGTGNSNISASLNGVIGSTTLTVNPAPIPLTITTQPANQTVTAGQTATFSVIASGTAPLNYQWRANGSPIPGANSSSYTTPPAAMTDSDTAFQVVVSDPTDSITSNAATLTVNASPVAPNITTQPASTVVTVGQSATFSVAASGSAPLSYQWQQSGSAISGAITASYTTPPTSMLDNGSTYSVVVSNPVGSIPSSAATLTVQAPPSITMQPANQTVNVGQVATFSVVGSGTAPLTYQWQKNGTAINGATSASYTTPATTANDNGATFGVMVTNPAGNMLSNTAILTVQVPPSITTQPANQTVNVGQMATFSAIASGTAPLTYQWQKNGTAINGATSASYTTPATTANDNGAAFGLMITNPAGNMSSNTAILTVQVPPSITTQPANQIVNIGQMATFSVVASGTAPLTYQWQENGSTISGATSASYTTPATTAADNASTFRVVVSNAAGNTPSGTATLTVQSPPSITTQPASVSVTAGQTANFSVAAAGTSPLSYQWQKNGANISGATSSSYTTPATKTTDNGASFVVSVTNAAGNISSGAAILTVNADTTPPNVSITAPLAGATVSGTIIVTASASDNVAVANVQLQVDGGNVGSPDTSTPYNFSFDTTTLSNGSHTLTAVATDNAGNQATSAPISVTVSNSNSLAGPLSVSKVNPRYFTTPNGNVVLLAGSHTWANLQDQGTPAPATFDYDAYMSFMKSHGHNLMHMWTTWFPNGGTTNEAPIEFTGGPFPWMRTGPGTANDGGLKWDLSQPNPDYYSRMRARIIQAGQNGIYVSIYLFNGYEFQFDVNSQDGNPFESGNNVNGVNCPNLCPTDNSQITPQAWTFEQQYLSQVINTVNNLDNVLYMVSNESPAPGSNTWQASVISYVKGVEAGLPKQHPVGMGFQYKGGSDQTLYNSAADWVSPAYGGGGLNVPPDATGQCPATTGNGGATNTSSANCKVVVNDTDHDCGACGSQAWVWQNFTRGNNTLFMDQYLVLAPSSQYPGWNNNPGGPCTNNQCSTLDPQWDSTRNSMGDILTYGKEIDLINMTPHDSLSSSGFCLANPGSQYLVYSTSNSFTLTTVAGTYTFEWFNPSTHSVVQTGSVTVTTSHTFTAPFSGDAVLWLHK